MPKITNDDFYPVVSAVAAVDQVVILQNSEVKKATASGLLGAPASVVLVDSETEITLTSLGAVLVVDNALAVNVYLPSVGAANIGEWLEVYRIGVGTVTIHAADADIINDSAAGGTVAALKVGQVDAAIRLRLITETRYAIASVIGSWHTA
jgi:hypothetical protein